VRGVQWHLTYFYRDKRHYEASVGRLVSDLIDVLLSWKPLGKGITRLKRDIGRVLDMDELHAPEVPATRRAWQTFVERVEVSDASVTGRAGAAGVMGPAEGAEQPASGGRLVRAFRKGRAKCGRRA
jgi:hypothetical protein